MLFFFKYTLFNSTFLFFIVLNNLENSQLQFIAEIKHKVRKAQYEALKAVNVELINLYWDLGRAIAEKQTLGWGKSIVLTLSKELQAEFPNTNGFSATK